MASEKAIEAAALSIVMERFCNVKSLSDMDQHDADRYRNIAKDALTAASAIGEDERFNEGVEAAAKRALDTASQYADKSWGAHVAAEIRKLKR